MVRRLVSAIAKKYGRSTAQLAIAWVLRDPVVTSALNGARTTAEIEDSVKGGDFEISKADLETIEKLLAERLKAVPPAPQGMPPGGGGPPPAGATKPPAKG